MNTPLALANIDEKNVYYFVFGSKCVKVERGSNVSDYAIEYDISNDSFQVIENTNGYSTTNELLSWDSYYPFTILGNKPNIKVQLNSLAQYTLPVSGSNYSRKDLTFPHNVSVFPNEETDLVWRNWTVNNNASSGTNLELATNMFNRNSNEVRAIYAKQYSASISTNLGGGVVYINGTQYNCSTSNSYIYDDLSNTITAYDQEYSGFIARLIMGTE